MYNHIGTAAGAVVGAGTLAMTGFDSVWLALAAFALIAAGTAVLRIAPRRKREV